MCVSAAVRGCVLASEGCCRSCAEALYPESDGQTLHLELFCPAIKSVLLFSWRCDFLFWGRGAVGLSEEPGAIVVLAPLGAALGGRCFAARGLGLRPEFFPPDSAWCQAPVHQKRSGLGSLPCSLPEKGEWSSSTQGL